MKLLILGATGATGKILVARALAQGHDVTAFVRSPEKLTAPDPNLHIARGDVLDPASLDAAIPGHDAVLFAVGSGDTKASTVRTDGVRNTIAAMGKAGVTRLIALSGLGAGITRKSLGFVFDKVVAPLFLRGLLKDQNGLESEIRKSKLEWVIVRPGEMLDVPASKTRPRAVSLDGTGISRSVPREDVARFMLEQIQSDEYVRKPAAIGH